MCLVCLTEVVVDLQEKMTGDCPPTLRMMALVALKQGVFKGPRDEARAKEIAEAVLAWSERGE